MFCKYFYYSVSLNSIFLRADVFNCDEIKLINFFILQFTILGFPGASEVIVSAWNVGDSGLIPESGRSPGEGNGNPLQYSCLENPMEGGAWWATVHGVTKSRTRLNDFTFTFMILGASLWLRW